MTRDNADLPEGLGGLRTISPNLQPHVMQKLNAFIEVKRQTDVDTLAASLRRLHELWQDECWSLELRAVALVLADLIEQGWEITATEDVLQLQPPGLRLVGETINEAKHRLRRTLQRGRDRQLKDTCVQKFLSRMHRVVPRAPGRSSIADVIDDGCELAALLRPIADVSEDEAVIALKGVIDPVIEICDEDAKCSVTGLRLMDIWRYFRHTWSLEYRSTPGRQLALLVRNVARPKRPVIGIAMLASPVVRARARDDWIGWYPEPFVDRVRAGLWAPETALRALVARLEQYIAELRSDDLVSADELAFPAERTILRLEQRSAGAAVARQRELEEVYTQAEEANEVVRSQRHPTKGNDLTGIDWRQASEEALFVRKRAATLARLLDAKRTFQALDWARGGTALLDALLQHPNGWRTLSVALEQLRKTGLSSQIADVSICGAVAPYNELLGGKLVALLMASKEVREAYRSRYADQVGVISSQMASRAIRRPAELKVLTTTSLYGNGSSQYNRLRLQAAEYPELDFNIEWKELATTAGYGTVHFGTTTVRVLREVSERNYRARRINHRFGEGSSPRMRQIREAVESLGIDSNAVLHHATPRIFYGCILHPGAIEELLGLRPLTASEGPAACIIAKLWRHRWLARRITMVGLLDRVAGANSQNFQEFFREVASSVETREAEQLQEKMRS